ncbi:MAG: isoleucine-tRNA ligase [Peltula sp. TS41687]|nr:MAG: isoleucine-tRNA ligase [Peltula sp. TS41687]
MIPTRLLYQTWTSTLRLPKSTFPPRVSGADLSVYLRRCSDDLYAWQRQHRPAKETFILHDGPPYANGSVHIGHALNKILKDIICRVQLGQGKRIHYVPGWDCHGLPIELKALQSYQGDAEGKTPHARDVEPVMLRQAAKELATRAVNEQRQSFKEWGVAADWDHAWTTMDTGYQLRQLETFRDMVERGLIYRQYKPVYWSPSSRTALAEAELEYNEKHESTAAFVKFPVEHIPSQIESQNGVDAHELGALIWTTTPWTLPANRAIAVNSDLEYAIVQSPGHGQLLIGESRISYVSETCFDNAPLKVIVGSIPGRILSGTTTYFNPLRRKKLDPLPFIHADFVSASSGSGLVHCAPGHGMEDYEICRQNGISPVASVDDEGRFTEAALPETPDLLAGKAVLVEGSEAVLQHLRELKHVLATHTYLHKYPYDWRTKLPVIIRATEQWFADVNRIKEAAMMSLENVRFVPPTGRARLESFVQGRSEWCISRQRAWGVPIPAVYHQETGKAILTPESVTHIMSVIAQRGIDSWWTDAEDDPTWVPRELFGQDGSHKYRRGRDTMDVWFDSGTSWREIEGAKREGRCLADVICEGTDQHRGWFQSSLLTYVTQQSEFLPARAPFEALITHGFTLDSEGRKMSKSLGNVISPQQILDGSLLPPEKVKKKKGSSAKGEYDSFGPDALRLWVASRDYTRDMTIGEDILKGVHKHLHKLRVTVKWILGALSDFDPASITPYEDLSSSLDHIALLQLSLLNQKILSFYQTYEFHRSTTLLLEYLYVDLSSFYLETIKDRLYADHPSSRSRLSCQTVLHHIFTHLIAFLSPITPVLVEEVWSHTPSSIRASQQHPLQRLYPTPPPSWSNASLPSQVTYLLNAKAAVNAAQEQARDAKHMGSSLESDIVLYLPTNQAYKLFKGYEKDLEGLFIVSSVKIVDSEPRHTEATGERIHSREFFVPGDEVESGEGEEMGRVYVLPPSRRKCERCWRFVVSKDQASLLCERCEDVIGRLDPLSN